MRKTIAPLLLASFTLQIRAKLWNEYRAYKGLPQIPADQ